ncbi:MAG: ATP-dependent sacrificial sulfur transferase LarE [Candidatus Omnitrophica bacterium]|nr:ATP-dependent sacrificial sulfur transferase LarE [Candidatus Omnitrophota bacterium]
MDQKIKRLNNILKSFKRVVIAYSGGLDSTFLLKAAVDALGRENVLAVTARSETYPVSEYRDAVKAAKSIGADHIVVDTDELNIKNFRENPVNRCYYCKKELFKKLIAISNRRRMAYVLDGTNYDDLKDIRHGTKAAIELGIERPLLKAKITKKDIRKFSKILGLPTWDKPSFACLASRFPFNSAIDKEGLKKVDEAESYLRKIGFKQVRVRIHGDIARLEILPADFSKAVKLRDKITSKLRSLGFVYIALDLAGYRTGSMHEAAAIRRRRNPLCRDARRPSAWRIH